MENVFSSLACIKDDLCKRSAPKHPTWQRFINQLEALKVNPGLPPRIQRDLCDGNLRARMPNSVVRTIRRLQNDLEAFMGRQEYRTELFHLLHGSEHDDVSLSVGLPDVAGIRKIVLHTPKGFIAVAVKDYAHTARG